MCFEVTCESKESYDSSDFETDSNLSKNFRRSQTSFMTSDSNHTRRTTSTTVQYFLNYDTPPALPARPVSMYLIDEPIYATIRDLSNKNVVPSQTLDNFQVLKELSVENTVEGI